MKFHGLGLIALLWVSFLGIGCSSEEPRTSDGPSAGELKARFSPPEKKDNLILTVHTQPVMHFDLEKDPGLRRLIFTGFAVAAGQAGLGDILAVMLVSESKRGKLFMVPKYVFDGYLSEKISEDELAEKITEKGVGGEK
jgi:hypothetical protein